MTLIPPTHTKSARLQAGLSLLQLLLVLGVLGVVAALVARQFI